MISQHQIRGKSSGGVFLRVSVPLDCRQWRCRLAGLDDCGSFFLRVSVIAAVVVSSCGSRWLQLVVVSSCGSRWLQLVVVSSCGSEWLQLVEVSSCGSEWLQLVVVSFWVLGDCGSGSAVLRVSVIAAGGGVVRRVWVIAASGGVVLRVWVIAASGGVVLGSRWLRQWQCRPAGLGDCS